MKKKMRSPHPENSILVFFFGSLEIFEEASGLECDARIELYLVNLSTRGRMGGLKRGDCAE